MKTSEDKGKDIVNILLEQLSSNSTARSIVEPPQIEGSTFDDWLYFFIQNAFIFFVWILSMVWVCYVVFYNSRLTGFIITKIVNYLFIKNGYFKIGSFSFAAISGKIMFRDLIYINDDYSIRIQDGWMVFCYWIPYEYRDAKTEDLSNSDVRLLIYLDGLKVHLYNQTERYSDLEKLFNLPLKKFFETESTKEQVDDSATKKNEKETREKILKSMNQTRNELKQSIWRDLIPMIKIEISSGRFIFGNHLIPSTLSISFEDSQFHYTSQPAASQYDLLTHILKGKAENLQVMLIPSVKYNGSITDEPPRIMGDGFNVFRTNKIEIYYYQDVPGFVTQQDQDINETDNPVWGMVVKCGKGTDFSYGPWADRQRGYLYSFFFPSNYQLMTVDEKPKLGERRRFESFDIRLSTLHEAKIDILFAKNNETHALHINAMPGSYLEATIPWICNTDGYSTHILGQILHLDATTSLQFRPLIQSETFEFDVKIFFPRLWNGHQEWLCKITACKATVNLIFAHKIFIQDLIDDWSDKERPDILKFIPYTWKISIVIKDFELLVLANQYNWIDCSTGLNDENCKIAICGEHFDLAFDLPFVEFLPPKLMIKIWIQGECLEGAFYLPESSMNRDIIELIQRFSNINDRNESCSEYLAYFGHKRKWKNIVSYSNHWYDCINAPIVAISITYDFWPMPILANDSNAKQTTNNEISNSIDIETTIPARKGNIKFQDEIQDFDVTILPSDVMTIELEIGPSNIALFGVLFRFLWNIKENYLGESQIFSEMGVNFFDDKYVTKKRSGGGGGDTVTENKKDKSMVEVEIEPRKTFDPRLYRPFEVIVSVTLHEIHGHLVQCLSDPKHYSPLVYVEKLCFELRKTYLETKLQLIISPAVIQVADRIERIDFPDSLKEGFLTLSSLQFRGHAMFSGLDRPLQSETLEYAWLVDVEVGEIGGRITMDQLMQIIVPLETFLFQIFQLDLDLQSPNPFYKCLHDRHQNECPESDLIANRLCPYPEDVKYRLVRVDFDKIDLFLIESNVTINLSNPSIRLATCNLHVRNEFDGFTLLVSNLMIRQFVSLLSMKDLGRTHEWAEISSISTGTIFLDSAIRSSEIDNYTISQYDFLRKHDNKTKRLWFLWNDQTKCGCVGNCAFFGCNLDGQNFFNKDRQSPMNKNRSSKHSAQCLGQNYNECMGKTLHNHLINLNYGESLLHPENYLLDLHSPLIDETNKALSNTTKSSQSGNRLSTTTTATDTNEKISTGKWSAISNDRFFSAEDLFLSGTTSLSSSRIERSISNNNDKSLSSSSSPNWQSPTEMLSPTTQYITAREHFSSSLDYSNGTSQQKLSSLSSDSPTLVSPTNVGNDQITSTATTTTTTTTSSTPCVLEDDQNSITSFMSAVSDHQSFDMVDLRNQLEKPIIESPLLMLAYSTYLSIYSSEYIDIPSPVQKIKICNYFRMKSPQALHFERLMFEYRNNWKPKFSLKKSGFSESKLIYYNDNNLQTSTSNNKQQQQFKHYQPGIVAEKFDLNRMIKDRSFLSDKEIIFSSLKSPLRVFNPVEQQSTNRSRTATTTAATNIKDDEISSNKPGRSETITTQSTSTMINTNNIDSDNDEVIEHCLIHIEFDQIEIKISTLTFDVMSAVMNSLTEIFSKFHPINLLNHCSYSIIDSIETKNILKKRKPHYIGKLHMKAWQLLKHKQTMKHLNRSISFAGDRNPKLVGGGHHQEIGGGNVLPANILLAKNLELDHRTYLSLNIEINRINISSLQASIVEEIISFSSLDNVKDLTCVLVSNISFDRIQLNMNRQTRQKRNLHVFMEQSSTNTEKALMIRFFTRKPKKVFAEIDMNAFETIDAFVNETQWKFSLKNIQSQLSRLINSPDIISEATLAIIPCLKTKVGFVFAAPSATIMEESQFQHFNSFVMFEFGIENISFTMNKSSYYNCIRIIDNNHRSIISTNSDNLLNHEITPFISKPLNECELKGNILNIWFHFASSSKKSLTSIRNDFDRYDWHLLSSLIPLTIAWISVFDRLSYQFDQMKNQLRFRICSSLACLLTNCRNDYLLQNQKNPQHLVTMIKPLQNNSKQMIRIFSALSKTIQDDPSFLLVNVLRLNFKDSFKTNTEFESYFLRPSIIPNNKELEKSLVLLLFHWKEVLNVPVSNFGQIFFHNQQPSTHSPKMTFSSTKNQILTLLEEKFNLMMNNPVHENDLKNATSMTIQSSTPEPPHHCRTFVKQSLNVSSENESVQINMNDLDTETTKLIYDKHHLPTTTTDTVNQSRDDLELQAEISSNVTRNTFPEYFDSIAKHRLNMLTKRQNRVHFVNVSRFRGLYDRFLATPIIRNISALCNNRWCHFCSFRKFYQFHRHRSQTTTSSTSSNDEQHELQNMSTPIVDLTTIEQQPIETIIPIDNNQLLENELNQNAEIGINIDDCDLLMDDGVGGGGDDGFHQPIIVGNNRYSSQSNYDNDKKDLYWWMVKQQDYLKNVNPNLASTTTTATNMPFDQDPLNETTNQQQDQQDQSATRETTTMFDEKKSAKETIRKYGLNCEATQYFENFSKTLGLSDVLDFDKLSEQEHDGIFGSCMIISLSVQQFGIQIEESDQDLQKNMFNVETLSTLLNCMANRNKQSLSDPLSFELVNLTTEAIVQKRNYSQINDAVNNNFRDIRYKNEILYNLMPNFSSTAKYLFKSILQKKSNENDLSFDTVNFLAFNIQIEQITQRINLPLLRFIHQFSAIYEDVSQTRFEMRRNRNIFTDQNDDSDDDDMQIIDDDDLSINSSLTTTNTTSDNDTIHSEHKLDKKIEEEGHRESIVLDRVSIVEQQEQHPPHQQKEPIIFDTRINNCWRTISRMLEQYQKTKSKLFTNQADQFEQFNEDDFYSVYSGLINKPLIIMVNTAVSKMNVIAMLSGLKLESELYNFNFSVSHQECRKKHKTRTQWPNNLAIQNLINTTIDINLDRIAIALFESLQLNVEKSTQLKQQQLVVKLSVEKSNVNLIRKNESDLETDFDIENLDKIIELLNSTNFKTSLDTNHARIMIGNVEIDIPQHPVALHGMMTRSGRQLTTTLQELRYSRQSSRSSRQPAHRTSHQRKSSSSNLISPLIVDFNFILESVAIKASLLPSLQAKYLLGQVTSSGCTGSKAKFIVDINNHSLCLKTMMESFPSEANASITLPRIHVDGEYKKESSLDKQTTSTTTTTATDTDKMNRTESFSTDGIVFRKGSYLNMVAEISSFEHSLTTDLLNHLLFVQKVFMKEINEVLQKVSRNESDNSGSNNLNDCDRMALAEDSVTTSRILFSLSLKMTGIQITATTPTNSAVRFETGTIDLRVSNRLMNTVDRNFKIFVRVQLDFNVALGQLIRNAIFEEAEPDFQQLAYFKTRICMRNASQNQSVQQHIITDLDTEDDDKEVVLITLNRPLVYIQPLALDKAILVWINYKNAYEYWNEQRASLNNEVLQATQQIFDKVHPFSSSQSLGTVLLQLTVDDFGICLPISTTATISKFSTQSRIYDSDIKDALVLTLESTRISALSRGSLVSKGEFKNLCIRFADDFETMLDDWKPDPTDSSIQNLCIVSEGTYQICSRTITHKKNHQMDQFVKSPPPPTSATTTMPGGGEPQPNYLAEAKWILNVHWKMDGFDIHVDTSIGKHISALFKTMTAIAGDEDDDDDDDEDDDEEEETEKIKTTCDQVDGKVERDGVPPPATAAAASSIRTSFINDSIDKKPNPLISKESIKKRNIEKEFNEQAKVINDLRQLGASDQTIQQEMERFQKLEAAVFNNFRRGVIKKLKRPSNQQNNKHQQQQQQQQSTTTTTTGNDGKIVKNRTYSQSINSYDELNNFITTNDSGQNRNQSFYRIDEELNTLSPTIQSSTISIPNDLNNFNDDNDSIDTNNTVIAAISTTSSSHLEESSSIVDQPSIRNLKDTIINQSIDSKIDTNKTIQTSMMNPMMMVVVEPRIDFELDVKIFFNSGKCVLHTKEQRNDLDSNSRNYSANDMAAANNHSPTNNNNNNNSLTTNRSQRINKSRSYNKLFKGSTYRKDYSQSGIGMNPDFTVFLIPGLDIKLNYSSKNINADEEVMDKEPVQSFRNIKIPQQQQQQQQYHNNWTESNNSLARSVATTTTTANKSTKKAILFAWITLSSIPDEIFISPHLLDFFEEALKPIPLTMSGQNSANATLSSIQSQRFANQINNNNNSSNDEQDGSSQYVYYSSFPVDVIVFFHFQPTIIRLGCLPISRVECLLHLPSIDLVMSSNRSEIDSTILPEMNTDSAAFQQLANKAFKNVQTNTSTSGGNSATSNSGGLSITGCLADFSLYIFHPYGGHKNKTAIGATGSGVGGGGNQSKNHPSYSTNDRKDSLSLQVEFVKINISRSRKLLLNDSLTQSISFSAICDIGTATFKYDVRRLNEILAFPKAWYRKSIWKKVFIGENTLNAIFSDHYDGDDETEDNRVFNIGGETMLIHSQPDSLGNDDDDDSSTSSSDSSSSISNSTASLLDDIVLESCSRIGRKKRRKKKKSKSHLITVVHNPWETLVLLTINFSKLNVSMNMGNIMGNVNWQTKELMCDGSISIDSNEHRKFRVGLCLNNSTLDAKGGIIGGIVELSDIRTEINVREDRNLEPQHRLYFSLHTIENRIDYMGTSILMVRISDLSASFFDKWNAKIIDCLDTKKPSIHVQASLKWDQMQILMSKSTSPDFMKIISKLEEFFTQQFHSGKRVFDSLHPTTATTTTTTTTAISTTTIAATEKMKKESPVIIVDSKSEPNFWATTTTDDENVSPKKSLKSFHRYWRKSFQLFSSIKTGDALLGGSIEVHAHNISLACFHGINFRSKSWAVFCLKEPSITFETEARLSDDLANVVQKLELVLGNRNDNVKNVRDNNMETMAIVSKISRTVIFPPQFRHLHEWFHYALSPVEINDVNRFPLPSCDNSEFDAFGVPVEALTPSQLKTSQTDRRTKSTSEFHYKEEMIFAFPSMRFELTTKQQLQTAIVKNSDSESSPKVLFSFRSDFVDHIYVAVDAEAYFFLHNLISSYINETTDAFALNNNQDDKDGQKNDDKEKMKKVDEERSTNNSKSKSGDVDKTTTTTTTTTATTKIFRDHREFICEIWQLEPTVRLHSWASKNIDPYGVDYILQRLGFNQARTTIPKWIQRSTMDMADKIISIVVYQMLKKDWQENVKTKSITDN
uniref:Transmembrane protein KIAA1109-like n=1 Tax=Dermatophagoides pteronyssinus TaxID=6956 RepID=A0A6P6YKI2_DERPT|nr:transmembrane protein KIAA1109-like [Dermatophagoides pteronyssinus]